MSPFPSSSRVVPESIAGAHASPIFESGFHLLASLFRYPDESLWQALAEALPTAETFSSSLLGHPLSLPPRHALEQTYMALFYSERSGQKISLRLSGYQDLPEDAEGENTVAINRLPAAAGLADDPCLKEPEDHLAALLERAGLLCHKAHGENPFEAADGRIRLLQLTDSLLVMLPPFQSAIAAADENCVDFYVDAVTLCLCLVVLCREQIMTADFTGNAPTHRQQTQLSAVCAFDSFTALKQAVTSGCGRRNGELPA